MKNYENLTYLKNGFSSREKFDIILEKILGWPLKIDTAGTETNIPKDGPLVVGFMPHCGWSEPVIINRILRKLRGNPAVWITKQENEKEIPQFMRSSRLFIFVDRVSPGPETFKPAYKVLDKGGVIASAFEGTRRGNPDNTEDFRFLTFAHPGLAFISLKKQVPLVPAVIIGCEKYMPSLEKEKAIRGISGVTREIIRLGLVKNKIGIQVRFFPPFELDEFPQGIKLSEKADFFTDKLLKEQILPGILNLDSNYPLGVYQNEIRR